MSDIPYPSGEPPSRSPHMARRKAATRSRLIAAADTLFTVRGYANTSMEDIAEAADIAVRTIYLHFPSKASIHLAYFDDWLDAFIAALLARPVDEPVADATRIALQGMADAGWNDHSYGEMAGPHPTVEFISGGPPDVAGHVMQRWVQAQDAIAADTAERGGFPPGSLEPRARAAAVFAAWVATLLAARDGLGGEGLPDDQTGNNLGGDILQVITRGSI